MPTATEPQELPRSESRHKIACACAGETEITWFARTYPLIYRVMTPSSLLAGCDMISCSFTGITVLNLIVPSHEFYDERHVEYSTLNMTILYRVTCLPTV